MEFWQRLGACEDPVGRESATISSFMIETPEVMVKEAESRKVYEAVASLVINSLH